MTSTTIITVLILKRIDEIGIIYTVGKMSICINDGNELTKNTYMKEIFLNKIMYFMILS